MKIKNILLILAIALGSSACSDWFDVSPKTNVKTDDLFKDETGFQSALTGCYVKMTSDETYGKNLSWYFLEKLVQRYDDTEGNLAGNPDNDPENRLRNPNVYNYTDNKYSKGIITEIWNAMYNNIANVNRLLSYLESNGKNVIKTPGAFELMKGEALALRAYQHFDLLRMYGPIYKENPEMKCIPYRTQFAAEKSPLLSASQILDLIIADLNEAETYLSEDPMDWGMVANDPFKSYRGHRMNKYAAKALLARVYLYRGSSEDLRKAGELAIDVIENCGLKLVRSNYQDITMFDETLFGLNMSKMKDRVQNYFSETFTNTGIALRISNMNGSELFEGNTGAGINDIRYKNNYGFISNINGMMTRKYLPTSDTKYAEKIPLIRLSEMYLIAAEATGNVAYLNDLRNARGISANYDRKEVTTEYLSSEYCKEYFAEGQYFYYVKRNGLNDFYRCPAKLQGKMSSFQYVFPLPDDEKEYNYMEENEIKK